MKFLCFLWILMAPALLWAQPSQAQIQGKVQDTEGQAVAFATVALKASEGGKVLDGAISDEAGQFTISRPKPSSFYLEISALGYQTQGQNIMLSEKQDLGSWTLKPDPNALAEVSVTAKRNRLTRKIDRLVLDVEDNAAFAGRSSLALFSSAPGVFVQDGNISINGMSGTRVMVNGRLLKLSGEDLRNYLENLKAEDIKAIEIIANPPAEYDAEGTGGLINIILKKNRDFGLTGQVGMNYTQGVEKYPGYRPNASLDYRKGKLSASVNYAYDKRKSFEEYTQERQLVGEGIYRSENESVNRWASHSVGASLIYDISDRQFIGLDYTGQYGSYGTTADARSYFTYPDPSKNEQAIGTFPSIDSTQFSNVGINYSWTTDTLGSKLSFIADYTYNNKQSQSSTRSQSFGHDGQLLRDTAFTFYPPSRAKIYTAELKYQQQLTSGMSISAGGKVSATDIDNHNHYDLFVNDQVQSGVNPFDYLYRERVYAGFVSLQGSFKGMEYSLGLRGEQSDIKGDLLGSSQDTAIRSNYFNWFPSVSLQKQLGESGSHLLTLAYSKRISRPSYSALNPYEYYLDNYSIAAGNPYLTPQFRHSVELGYLFKQRYYAALSYSRINDVINEVIENDPHSGIMRALRKNTGRFDVLSATFSVPVKVTNWWNMTNNLVLDYKASKAPEFDIHKTSFVLQTEQSLTLPKDWSMNLSAYYTPRVLTGNLVTGRVSSVDVGVRKTLLDKRLQLSANISDIFYTNNFDLKSYYNGNVMRLGKKWQSREITVSARYNFNIGKAFQAKRLNKSNADEQGRL